VTASPRSVPAHLELARAYSAANQLQLSTVEYLAVAQLDPANPEANTGLALAAFVAGQPQEAKQMADKVLSGAPGYPEALYARGLIQLMGLKQAAAAERDLTAYLAAAPYGAHRSTVQTLLAMIAGKARK
jgi:tetratricopeptide (TPR) repeat protein